MASEKIEKLVVPLYEAESKGADFEDVLEEKFGLQYEFEGCETCGSKIFYVRSCIATKELKVLDSVPQVVDLELICAECGTNKCGFVISEKFSKELDKPKRGGK